MCRWLFSLFLLLNFRALFVQEVHTEYRECAKTGCAMTLISMASKALEWTVLIAHPVSTNETVNSICQQVWWPTEDTIAVPGESCPQDFHNISTLFLGLSCCITITSILGDRCVRCMYRDEPHEQDE